MNNCLETDNIVLTEHESYSWQTVEEIINNPKITHEVKNTIKRYNDIKLEYEAMIEKYKIKSEKWDKLDEKIGKFYENDIDDEENEDGEDEGNLIDIGEVVAIAFGYL